MKKIVKFMLTPLLVFLLLTTTFASENPAIIVNNKQLPVTALNKEGRVLVPLRPIFEALNVTVDYDESAKIITAQQDDKLVILKIGDKIASVNGENITLDVPACIIESNTFVPIRFVGESLSAKVDWANNTVTVDLDNDVQASKAQQIADFSFSLFAESFEEENILMSPLSIVSALGMVTNGAKENTLSQMEQVLNSDIASLNEFLQDYRVNMPSDEKYKVSLANSIWFKDKETLTVNEDFIQLNKDYYNADIYKTPFNEQTKDDINNWVNAKTDGMIESLLDKAPPEEAVMYLINALSFDAEWANIYKDTQIYDNRFRLENGQEQDAKFMSSRENSYLENESVTGFIKPYQDNKYAFVALLPKENISMSDLLKTLDGQAIMNLLDNKKPLAVQAQIPKFSVTYDTLLNEPLQELGMLDAFSRDYADFTGLAKSTDGNIFINRVIHKTKIDLDERGTKAGAITAIEMVESTGFEELKEVVLDRPFFYMIVDTEQNIPLFMGSLMSLE